LQLKLKLSFEFVVVFFVVEIFTNCVRIRLYGGAAVFQLHKLVSHERPRLHVSGIEFESALKVRHCLVVVVLETVVVANDAATLRPVFVDFARLLSQYSQLGMLFLSMTMHHF
jgi:hypothetical protein